LYKFRSYVSKLLYAVFLTNAPRTLASKSSVLSAPCEMCSYVAAFSFLAFFTLFFHSQESGLQHSSTDSLCLLQFLCCIAQSYPDCSHRFILRSHFKI